jgi:hypothetical protein
MCIKTNHPTLNLNARRGSNPKRRRISLHYFFIGLVLTTIIIFTLGYHLFYRSSRRHKGLTEGFRHGNIRVWGLTGHESSYASDYTNTKATIGYAVTITHCPPSGSIGPELADAAAILKHSIHLNSIHNSESGSRYDYQMYALVHSDVASCVGPTLKSLGYKVLMRRSPLELKYIEGEYLRERLLKEDGGCCGINEFTKLHAYTLVAHPAVVLVDLDTMVLKPMDHLFDAMMDDNGATLIGGDGGSGSSVETAFGDAIGGQSMDAYYTREYSIARDTMKHVPVQGGFLVVRPSLITYADFSSILRKGDYREDGGWAGLGFGPSQGSSVFQDLIPYYYDHVHAGTGVELNRCVYNNIVDDPRDGSDVCRDEYNRPDRKDECEDCRSRPVDEVSPITEYFSAVVCRMLFNQYSHCSKLVCNSLVFRL